MGSSEEEVAFVADLVRHCPLSSPRRCIPTHKVAQIKKGAASARSDDTKSLKGAILDWITPRGQPLNPPLSRNVKIDRGFHHERTGALLCPAGVDWSNNESVLSDAWCETFSHLFNRTKEKLRNGELSVSGDHWPIFLYHGYHYDKEDPWNGLFRSSLLVTVRPAPSAESYC